MHSAERKVSLLFIFLIIILKGCFDGFVIRKERNENFPPYFLYSLCKYSYFLIFLINALSSPSTWICIWNMSSGDNLFTVFYKHEMKKKYKERAERKTTHWRGCIETNVLRKILFAMTLLLSHLMSKTKWGTGIEWRRNKKFNF